MKYILSLLMFLMPLFTKAYDIEVNGIYYNLDENNRTAKVTASTFYDKYSGDIIIPDVINHNETEYFVTEIESFAFSSSDLTSVVIGNNVIKVGELAFWESVDKYRSANQWKLFGNIVAIKDDEPYPMNIRELNSRIGSHNKSAVYTIHGKQIDSPQRGINIIHTEDGKTRKVMIK